MGWSMGPPGGGWDSAVVEPQALSDLLAAQRARAQGLAALVAAADVAAVEEDHLGLRRDRGCVWVPPLPVLSDGGPGPPAVLYPQNLLPRSSRPIPAAHESLGHLSCTLRA